MGRRLLGWCKGAKRNKALQLGEDRLADHRGCAVVGSAVHHPMADRHRQLTANLRAQESEHLVQSGRDIFDFDWKPRFIDHVSAATLLGLQAGPRADALDLSLQ